MVTYGKKARKEKPSQLKLCTHIFNCILDGSPFVHRPHTFRLKQQFSFSFCHLSNVVSSVCLWTAGGNWSTRRNLQPPVGKMSKFHRERPQGWNQTQAVVATAPQGANPRMWGQFLTKISHQTDRCWDGIMSFLREMYNHV